MEFIPVFKQLICFMAASRKLLVSRQSEERKILQHLLPCAQNSSGSFYAFIKEEK